MHNIFKPSDHVKRNKTFIHQFYTRLELFQENNDVGRHYITPSGKKYPSVTTVLSKTLDKTGLENWVKRVGVDEAEKIKKRASNRGTKLHFLCEHYLLNSKVFFASTDPFTLDLFKQIQPFLDTNIEKIYGIEMPLYSDNLRTAGKCDLFCSIQDKFTVVDFKTSTSLKREEWIDGYFYQLTAYAIMIEERYNIKVPDILVIVASEEGTPQFFSKKTDTFRAKVTEIFSNYSS